MDDEIDIEEHDILEHPQVKAAFPDLSKIQIEVHTSGGSFLDDTLTHLEESLLEERQEYTINDLKCDDSSKIAPETENEDPKDLKVFDESEDLSQKETGQREKETTEIYEISDSECTDEVVQAADLVNDNIEARPDIDCEERNKIDGERSDIHSEEKLNVDIEEVESNLQAIKNKDDIQVISEDEFIDENQYDAANKLIDDTEEGMAVETESIGIAELTDNSPIPIAIVSRYECKISPEFVENVHIISDDETEPQELAETLENSVGLIEDVTRSNHADEALACIDTAATETGFIDKALENIDESTKVEVLVSKNRVHERVSIEIPEIDKMKCSQVALDIYQRVSIKEEIEYETENISDFDESFPEEKFNDDDLPPEDIYHFKNKIILGSKPSLNRSLDTRTEMTYLEVLLEDWNVHLSNSLSYCSDCKTLFATPNALDAHRMTAHSLLAPITNRAVKSTAKSSLNIATKSTTQAKNIAKKSTGVGYKFSSSSTFCNHCNVTFKDHTTLIKHLYLLLPDKKYSCNFCDAVFQSQNELVNHNSIHIKIEPRKILKAKTKSDNPILRNILSKDVKPILSKALKRGYPTVTQTPSKSVKFHPVQVKKEPEDQCRFKCLICSHIFDTYGQARKHRLSHPDSVSKILFKKIPAKKVKSNWKHKLIYEDEENIKSAAKNGTHAVKEEFEFIPKSALFQCSKCGLHFSSCVAGISHVGRGQCGDKHWSCPTCKKTFRKIDEICHRKQHKLSHKFKVYNITRNIYEKILCMCSKCGVYFDYHFLKKHVTKCGKIPTAKCLKCNILLPKDKLVEHARRHDIIKMKPKDFILIDYAVRVDAGESNVAENKTNVGRKTNKRNSGKMMEPAIAIKIEPETLPIVKKLKFDTDKVRLYYCKNCKCCLSRRSLTRCNKIHLTKKCVGRKYTSHCKICGLQLSQKSRISHASLHMKKNLTLKDFVFYEFGSLKPIIPSTPIYPSCNKCKIHFLDRILMKNHICGEDYENCEVCGEKFENSALRVHLPFHRLLPPKATSGTNDPKIMPELMMKYESLNAIWNILFICGTCELVTDLYNKTVEHSQGHLQKDQSQPNTIKCYICNLKFDESCWSKHSELHSRMTLNNKDFKILKYTPKNLLDESWFQMFESLPEKEIRQIIDRSVFGSERSLKMNLVKDGLPEFTVYCCSICQVAYNNNDILDHVKSKCGLPEHVCTTCDLAFDALATLHFHELLHKKGIKKEEFRIVSFVKALGKKKVIKNKIVVNKAGVTKKPGLKVKKIKKKLRVLEKKKEKQYILYKCVQCSSCMIRKYNLDLHKCGPDHHLAYCKHCKQNFSFRQIGNHNVKHKTMPQLKAKNIKIINFNPKTGKNKTNTRNVKSNTSKRNLSRKAKRKKISYSSDSEMSAYGSELELTSTTKTKERKTLKIPKHDNSSSPSIESDTEEKKTAKLYRCDCGLHYTSLRTIEKHLETCDNGDEISKEKCSKCRLLFPTDILVSHLCKHHSHNMNLVVEEVHKPAAKAPSTQHNALKDNIKLYKCSECNVFFLNQNSCYKHTYKHEALDPKQYIECKMCSLQFRILSLHIHMKKHHESEFNLEKVLIEEYQPNVRGKTPKIDIYFANDRFQNVQVSSSND